MKKSILVSLCALACLASLNPEPVEGQSTNSLATVGGGPSAPGSVTSFVQQVEDYFTVQDTNSTAFSAARGAIWTAPVYQSGLNIADQLGIEYQPWKDVNLVVGSVTENPGIAGTIVSEQVDLGWKIVKYDVQLTLGIGGGSTFNPSAEGFIALYGEARKAIGAHTFAGLRLEEDFNFKGGKPAVPLFGVEVGFTF